jgi:myo-inositol-1(or 4)-monophosphatase
MTSPTPTSPPDLGALLELAKSAATAAGARLLDAAEDRDRSYSHAIDHPREIKAAADVAAEACILAALAPAGLPLLSEESGYTAARHRREADYWFIVDPLDGTFNYAKGVGPCAVSIALWQGEQPVFGVIYNLQNRRLSWGGPALGAYEDGRRLSVSATPSEDRAVLCTGFPARLDLSSDAVMRSFWRLTTPYAKVRMLGSAAVSLLHVACGAADAYAEDDIMLWDVAAGIAMVEGAGGRVRRSPGSREYSLDVRAWNGVLAGPD